MVRFSLETGSASVGLNVISHWDHLFPRASNALGFSGSFIILHIPSFVHLHFSRSTSASYNLFSLEPQFLVSTEGSSREQLMMPFCSLTLLLL